MTIFSQIAVLLLLTVFAAVFLIMLRRSKNGGESRLTFSAWETDGRENESGVDAPYKAHSGTRLLPFLFVDQLDPQTMKLIQRFPVCEIPESGVSISRPNATAGDILLKKCEAAFTVSQNHARIGRDEQGIYIQDQGSHNKMYRSGSEQPVEQLDITDGSIVYLGMQPLRFSFPRLRFGGDMETRIRSQEEGGRRTMSQIYREEQNAGNRRKGVMRRHP